MFVNIALILLYIWLIIATLILYKTKRHYDRLVSSTKKGGLDVILEKLISDDQTFITEIEKIKNEVSKIKLASKTYFQKLGMVRFNPFERMGGEQSFVLAILDHEDNGIVVNFLYTREGIRVYAKKVKTGKGVEHDLSDEEKAAIKKSGFAV